PGAKTTNLRRYGESSPFSLRVVLMFATFAATVSIRARCAESAEAPISKLSNMLPFPFYCLRHPFFQRRFDRAELPAQQLGHHVVHQGVLHAVGHQLFHRAVVSVVKKYAGRRILDLSREVVEAHRAGLAAVSLLQTLAQHALEFFRREIL